MNCKEVNCKLVLLIDKDLSKDIEKEILTHLSVCESCQKSYDKLKETFNIIEIEKNKNLNPFLFTRIQQANQNDIIEKIPFYYKIANASIIALVVFVALSIGILIGSNNSDYFIQAKLKNDRVSKLQDFANDFIVDNEKYNY